MIKLFQKNKDILLPAALWLMVWAGYNTGIYLILEGNFFNSPLHIIHGLRAFLPILAGVISLFILTAKKSLLPKNFLFTPIGCLLSFSLLGIMVSIGSPELLESLYWGFMYASVLLVLILNYFLYPQSLKNIIVINCFIAGFILFALSFSFILKPGVAESLNFNSLICSQRPFEGLGGTKAEAETFGMPGSRPTGMARYAGIIAIIAFSGLVASKKRNVILWLCINILTLPLLLFTKGKAALLAAVIAMGFLLFSLRKISISALVLLFLFCLAAYVSIFYKIPCINTEEEKTDTLIAVPSEVPGVVSVDNNDDRKNIVSENINSKSLDEQEILLNKELKKLEIQNLMTLSGRVNGVWKDAFKLYLGSPIFGYGFNADRIFLQNQHVHNVLLHSLIQAGVVGTIIFILGFILLSKMFYFLIFKTILQERQRVFLLALAAILIFIIVRGITESFVYYSADWLFLAPIIAYVQLLYFNKAKASI